MENAIPSYSHNVTKNNNESVNTTIVNNVFNLKITRAPLSEQNFLKDSQELSFDRFEYLISINLRDVFEIIFKKSLFRFKYRKIAKKKIPRRISVILPIVRAYNRNKGTQIVSFTRKMFFF